MTDQTGPDGGYGLEPTPTAPVAPPPLPAKWRVDLSDRDLRCRRCGFNLRGLQPEGNCPECGSPIWMTLEGNVLLYSSPEYLRTLSHGLAWILIASLSYLCLIVLAIVFGIAQPGPWIDAMLTAVDVPLSAALLYGWWRFSTPDVAITVGDRGDWPRLIVRWASIINLGVSMLATVGVLVILQSKTTNNAAVSRGMFEMFDIVSMIAALVQFFASLVYMRWIADRMQSPALAQTATRYLWLLPLITILGACLLFIGPLVAWVMYLLLLNDVRRGINIIMERQDNELIGRVQAI